MPAQIVAGAPAPTVTGNRAAPNEARDAGTTGGHFGRQLDAARQDQPRKDVDSDPVDRTPVMPDADAQPATETAAEAVAGVPGFSDVIKRTFGGGSAASGKITDATDQTSTDSVPQGVFAMLAPLLGGASVGPGATGAMNAGRTLTAALASGGVAGVLADAANAARASVSLQISDADTQAASAGPAGLAGNPLALSVLLDAAQPHAGDDLQTPAAPAAGSGANMLPPLAATVTGVPILSVASPVGTSAFDQEFGRQVTWLATQDLKQARIRLHPEELGQVDLKISVDHHRVDVAFTVQHPGAAQAVQQSLLQLDQMLAQQGLSLGHTEVGQHGSDGSSSRHRGADTAEADNRNEPHAVDSLVTVRPSSLLDAFA